MFSLLRSLVVSAWKGVASDPELQKLSRRYSRLFHFIKKRLTPDEAFGLHLTVGLAFTLLFVYYFFGVLESYIGQEALIQADLRIINLVQIFRTPAFNKVMLFVTQLGGPYVVVGLTIAVVALLLWRRDKYTAATLLLSVVGGEAFVWVVKNIIARPRPPLVNALAPEKSYSFPSGHSFVAITLYGFLTYIAFRAVRKSWKKAFVALTGLTLIAAIGFSRVYLGVHWFSDVLASYAAGTAWLIALITATEIRLRFYHTRKKEQPEYVRLAWALVSVLWVIMAFISYQLHPLANVQSAMEHHDIGQSDLITIIRSLPSVSENITGGPMEPVNIIVVADEATLQSAFQQSGWFAMDQVSFASMGKFVSALIKHAPYPEAPGSPAFWNARPNDLSFAHPTENNTPKERHHVHFWDTGLTMDGKTIWFGTAHYDKDLKLSTSLFVPTHGIDPQVDKQREYIKQSLEKSGAVDGSQVIQLVEPTLGHNQLGDAFFTDGKAYILTLTPTP